MINKVKTTVIIINYSTIILTLLVSCLNNDAKDMILVFLFFMLLFSYSIRTFFFSSYVKSGIKSKMFLFLDYLMEMVLIFLINRLDPTRVTLACYIIVLDDVVMNGSKETAIANSIILYICSSFSIILYAEYAMDIALPTILLSLPIYLVVYIIFLLLKYLIRQTEIIEENLKDITVKKLEKDIVYDELKEAYKRVENLAAMKERNRIAREIHDTVGHTLTTVLVEIEASKRLINKDTEKALEKLNLAQEQVRKGLNDIRASVRILERGQELMSFSKSLSAIIEDTKKHSEVAIKAQIEEVNLTKEQQKVILSALLEGLTNGIRHGKSTAFLLRLTNENGHVFFYLSDNGKGTAALTPGFGLKAMRERVEELGGKLSIITYPEEGLELCIEL